MELRPELLDKLKQLGLEAYEMIDPETNQGIFAMKGPTWCVNPKTSLASFKEDFISDEHGSMRDYAAVPQFALTPFFPDPDLLDRKAIVADKFPVDRKTLALADWFKPNIALNYFFAGDLSVSGDRTGLALVTYNWLTNKIELVFSFAMKAEPGQRIDYEPIRQLIYRLVDRGFNIKQVLFDQFQSNDSINQVIQHGIDAVQVNYAESFVGQTQLQELIYTDKFVYDDQNWEFIGEAKHLQVVNSKRIDHMMTGPWKSMKDTWDAVVNATVGAINDYYKNGSMSQANQTVSNVAEKLLLKEKPKEDPTDISWIL